MDTLNRDEFPEILSALQEPKSETDGKFFWNGLRSTKLEIRVAEIAKTAIKVGTFLFVMQAF